jgi:hypothetical protein
MVAEPVTLPALSSRGWQYLNGGRVPRRCPNTGGLRVAGDQIFTPRECDQKGRRKPRVFHPIKSILLSGLFPDQ